MQNLWQLVEPLYKSDVPNKTPKQLKLAKANDVCTLQCVNNKADLVMPITSYMYTFYTNTHCFLLRTVL